MAKCGLRERLFVVLASIGFAWTLLPIQAAFSQTATPSVRIVRGTLISPSSAASYYGGSETHTHGLCRDYGPDGAVEEDNDDICPGSTVPRPPEVTELARALHNDPNLIYEYVRNRIDTEFLFGSHKGSLGVIIDGSGTAFDQAALMVELLRAAGHTANYRYGQLELTGEQFEAWTGITNADAASDFLATGGIPAVVSEDDDEVDNVVMSHVWVEMTVGENTYFFDPSYKPYNHTTRLSTLLSDMDYAVGDVGTAARSGMTSSTESGTGYSLDYVSDLNDGAVTTTLDDAAEELLERIRLDPGLTGARDLRSGDVRDLVGGREIVPAVREDPDDDWLQSTPANYDPGADWTNVPDQYRATLTITGTRNATLIFDEFEFFVDEIYGRRLQVAPIQVDCITPCITYNPYAYAPVLQFDGVTLFEGPGENDGSQLVLNLVLEVDHPFAADSGNYGDRSIEKPLDYILPASIVHGWGATSPALAAAFDRELGVDGQIPFFTYNNGGGAPPTEAPQLPNAGDLSRARIGASWLAQSTRAREIHAEIANARDVHLHSIGVVSADSNVFPVVSPEPPPGGGGPTPPGGFNLSDETTVIDIETSFGLVSRTSNVQDRRAAVLAIAATMATLEGSLIEQTFNTPDTASTARRFAWGNSPEVNETPVTTSRRVFEFDSGNADDATHVVRAENLLSGAQGPFTPSGGPTQDPLPGLAYNGLKARLDTAINAYAAAGYDVVAVNEAILGPGHRHGSEYVWSYVTYPHPPYPSTPMYARHATLQAGGALIAIHYDGNGDPDMIAHALTRINTSPFKGGGGSSVSQAPNYDPNQAADALRDRWTDRSTALGVNLSSGTAGFTSPTLDSIGPGEFPHRLSLQYQLRGGGFSRTPHGDPGYDVRSNDSVASNWHGSLNLGGSGLEGMGASRLEAATPTIAAFVAMQDVYREAAGGEREMTAMLVADWWGRQLAMNTVTVNQGGASEQFVRLIDGSYIPTSGGASSVTVSGEREARRGEILYQPGDQKEATTRTWNYDGVSVAWAGAQGDARTYNRIQIMTSMFDDEASSYFWTLNTWTFPRGVTLTLGYGSPSQVGLPVSVTSNMGHALTIPDAVGLTPCVPENPWIAAPEVTLSDALSNETRAVFQRPVTRSVTRRPIAECRLTDIFLPDNDAFASVHYVYDDVGHIEEAWDRQALIDADAEDPDPREPYRFYVADGYRGARQDPLDGVYSVTTLRGGVEVIHLDELNRRVRSFNDHRRRVVRRIFPEGDESRFVYDARDNVIEFRRVAKPGSALADIVIAAEWNEDWNKPNWIVDARGYRTDFTYDPSGAGMGELATAVRPAPSGSTPVGSGTRPTYTFTYDTYGLVATTTDPTGVVVENEYDGGGRLISTTLDPTGVNAETTFSNFTSRGDPQTTLDPRGNATSTTYDALRRPTVIRRHDGNASADVILATETSYDEMGRVTQTRGGTAFSGTNVSAWLTQETRSYTPTGQVSTITNGEGDVSRTCYDPMDRAYRTVDGVGRARVTLFDAAGQAIEQQGWWSANIEDDECELTSTLPGGQTTRHLAQRAYTLNGQVAWVDDANDNRSAYVYDGFDRLIELHFPVTTLGSEAASATDWEGYGYDPNGNRTSLRLRSSETIGFTFDNLNRESVKDIPGGTSADVYTAYDLAGRRLSSRFVSGAGQGIIYTYDTAGRLDSETTFGRALSYQYDLASNRTRITHPDSNYWQYTYDAVNRVDLIRENGSTTIADYGYDPLGRRATLTRGNGSVTEYDYDDASRMTGLDHDLGHANYNQTFTFAYTEASQLASRTTTNDLYTWAAPEADIDYTRNGLNQYTNVDGDAFNYDARGNLISDGSRNFQYDLENRLLQVSGSASLNLIYDPLGRLRSTDDGSDETDFLYDGDALVAEYDGGTLLRRYVHGPSVDEPILWYEGDDLTDLRYMIADRLGSIIAQNGATSTRYTYGPYGEPEDWGGSRFRYTGQIMLHEVMLYHYKNRIYDPVLGRFLQTDPVGYEDDLNLYQYVRNDPLSSIDPTGACVVTTDEDGNTTAVGICGSDEITATLVRDLLADPASASREVEAEAVAQGKYIEVASMSVGPDGHPVAAARTITYGPPGDPDPNIAVLFDPSDTLLVNGYNASTGEAVVDHPMSDLELLEHEIVTHVFDRLTGGPVGDEVRAVKGENAYRERRGDDFRRVGHEGRTVPRQRP